MAATSFDPAEIDIAILREMYRGGAVNLAGVDPRLNATRIARSLKVGRARVAARLKWWREAGFLRKFDVWINPALLGWQGAWVPLRVGHHRVKPELIERLALVDGVVSGLEFLGEWLSVGVVAPDGASLNRRVRLLRHMPGVTEVDTAVPWVVTEPTRRLTPLDVRIVRALRHRPMATLSEIARTVGISTRTMTRRYSDLLDDRAVWFVPVFDFRALTRPVVSLTLHVRPGTAREDLSEQIRSRFPLTLDFTTSDVGPEMSPLDLVFFVTLPSAAYLEELERLVGKAEGVENVESYVMVRILDFPEWFDSHLESLVSPVGRGPRTPADRAIARRG
ncbi:MAG TPA: AsnC family transcriptional regulator [Thermoplasmata archaeon]|nr:AsnC family transcriptional regulator [Thermoplasmata archaeon]